MWGKFGFAESRSENTQSSAENGDEVDSGDVPTASEAQIRSVPPPAHSVDRESETHEKSN